MLKSQFWSLESPKSTRRLASWAEDMDYESTVICPINDGHQRAGKRMAILSIALPRYPIQDFVWTWGSTCLLRDSALEVFKNNGFTGFEVKRVKAKFKRPNGEPPRLWELVVTGWAGVAPPESGIRLVESCAACGDLEYSAWTSPDMLINSSQWDGSDFFMVWPLPVHIFVTERVTQVIRDNKFSGGVLKPSRDLVFPTCVIPSLSPGRLSYWMPEERAHELGDDLGIY